MKLEVILLKVQSIKEIINIRLGEIDAGPLGNNPLSDAAVDVMVAEMVREISKRVIDRKVSSQLFSTGRSMMESSTSGLIAGYDDGDDICPPFWPFPHFGWGPVVNPHPVPWFNQRFDTSDLNPQPLPPRSFENLFTNFGFTSREIMMAEALRILASLTTSKEFNEAIKSAALHLMRGSASNQAYDEFDNRCGSTGPRNPIGPRRWAAAEQ